MGEKEITDILYAHFQARGDDWAGFGQLRLGTGFTSDQTMDFFAMALIPSLKFKTIGFEIKISRRDFLTEIKNPQKRLMAMTLCDEFNFVAPEGLLQWTEMPRDCGLWEVSANGEITKKLQKYRDTSAKLVCPSWPFIASIMRRQSRKEKLETLPHE